MRVFILEDDPDRIRQFAEVLKDVEWDCIHTCERAYDFKPPYDIILLDHDLGGRQMVDHEDSGYGFVMAKGSDFGDAQVIIHSYNPEGAMRMQQALEDDNVYAQRIPFGPTLLGWLKRRTTLGDVE